MKKVFGFLVALLLLVLVAQGCATNGENSSQPERTGNIWNGTVGGTLDVRTARKKLVQTQLQQDLEVITSGPQLVPEAKQEMLDTNPVVILENTTGQVIDLLIYDKKDRRKRPLALKVGPRRTLVLPRDHPATSEFFRYEQSYRIEFGYLGRSYRAVGTMYVGAQGGWYDISSLDDGESKLVWYHGRFQFRRGGGGIGLYNGG